MSKPCFSKCFGPVKAGEAREVNKKEFHFVIFSFFLDLFHCLFFYVFVGVDQEVLVWWLSAQ